MGDVRFDWSNYLEYAAETDIGMRRANNQDSHAAVMATSEHLWRERGHFFIVADGMGAHAAGELASKMAVDGVPHRYHKSPVASPPEAILQAILETNAEIFRRGHENNEFLHMGTTASMLVILPQGAIIAHVGDSRVYRLRGSQFQQMTFDHSLVWELRAAGQFNDNSELANVVPKNVITRSLGPNANVQIDLEGPLGIETGDVFLLCSDGLTGRLEDDELAAVLANYPPAQAAPLLIDLANLRGGQDNITVIIVKVLGEANGTHTREVKPITIGHKEPGKSLVQSIGVAVAVFALMTLVFLITSNWLLALAACASGLGTLGWLKWYRSRLQSRATLLSEEQRLGRAPYSTTECPSPSQFRGTLASLVEEMRQYAEEANWVSSWNGLSFAGSASSSQPPPGEHALATFAQVVTGMMREVRRQQKRKSGDSSVIY